MKRFDSERDMVDDLFGLRRVAMTEKSWSNEEDEWERFENLTRQVLAVPKAEIDARRREHKKKKATPEPVPVVPRYDIDAKAEEIAQLSEDPVRTPNLILFRQPDDPYPKVEWRRAAKRAGELLNRTITVQTTGIGRLSAILEQNPEEQEAERRRLGDVMDSVLNGSKKPPPLPRRFR